MQARHIATAADVPWNANIHYHSVILDAIPEGATRVLDVGCGDGILSAQIAATGVPAVVGLDLDTGVLQRAKARHADVHVEWMQGDVFKVPFERGSFDAVVSVAALHHMDARAALTRFAELVRPHGTVAIVGLAACDWWDRPYEAFGQSVRMALGLARGHWEHSAPMAWPPPVTYSGMKRLASATLPGVSYTRRLMGRYSLIWRKPL